MRPRDIRFLIVLFVALVSPIGYATTHETVSISTYSIELEVNADEETVHETVDVFFTATAPTISLLITPEFENLEVVLDGSPIQCTTEATTAGTSRLTCPLGKETRNRFLTVTYDSSYPLLSLNGDQIMIRHRYTPLIQAEEFDISVILPSGYVVEDTARYIVPEPTTIYSDGQRIIVGWERTRLIESFGISVVTAPLNNGSMLLVFGMGGIILLALTSFVAWRFHLFSSRKRESRIGSDHPLSNEPSPLREIVYPDLLESEEKVVDALKANLGVLKQKDLVRITGFSKAKMSRLLKQMESRNIIKSKPYGNSRKIYLVTERDRQQNSIDMSKIETTKEQSISKPDDTTQPETKL